MARSVKESSSRVELYRTMQRQNPRLTSELRTAQAFWVEQNRDGTTDHAATTGDYDHLTGHRVVPAAVISNHGSLHGVRARTQLPFRLSLTWKVATTAPI